MHMKYMKCVKHIKKEYMKHNCYVKDSKQMRDDFHLCHVKQV